MFVKLWMTSNVLTVNISQPIIEVEQIMRENRIRKKRLTTPATSCSYVMLVTASNRTRLPKMC